MPEASEGRSGPRGRWRGLSFWRKLRFAAEFAAAFPFLGLVYALPEAAAVGCARFVGRGAYYVLPGRRRAGLANLAIAFPELPERERRRILIRSLANLAQTAAEFVRLPRLSAEQIRERVSYAEGSHENIPKDQGHLLITGHVGNWELAAIAHGILSQPLYVVGRPVGNPIFDSFVRRRREMCGNVLLSTGTTEWGGHSVTDELKRGRVLALLVDQYPSRRKGTQALFFGKLAWCHRGPAVLALRSGAPCVPIFACRDRSRPGCYVLHVRPPIFIDPKLRSRERVQVLTEQLQKAMEDEIRERPEEWLWTHRRWKRTPDGDALYGESARRSRRGSRRSSNRSRRQDEAEQTAPL